MKDNLQPNAPPKQARPLVGLGQIVATPGTLEKLNQEGHNPKGLLTRNVTDDFGATSYCEYGAIAISK